MEQAIAALIIITIILFGILTLGHGLLAAQDAILESWQATEGLVAERHRTRLAPIGARALAGGELIEVWLRNDGQVRLADYERWDVIVQYTAAGAHLARWYPHVRATEPGPNQWAVAGIYHNAAQATAEAHEPGILNPGEELVMRVKVSPPVAAGTAKVVTVATANGVSATAVVAP